MRCIEIEAPTNTPKGVYMINRNMRCIEMNSNRRVALYMHRLIETWDVLKLCFLTNCNLTRIRINRNMRCIEISLKKNRHVRRAEINRNMRCIEIKVQFRTKFTLKLINRNMRCIEMDVNRDIKSKKSVINRNMRCIEMTGLWASPPLECD